MPNHNEVVAFGELLKKRNIVLVFLEGLSYTGKTHYTTLKNPPNIKITLDFTSIVGKFPKPEQELIKGGQGNTTISKLYYTYLCQHFWDVLKKHVADAPDNCYIAVDRAPMSNFVYQLVHSNKDKWGDPILQTIARDEFIAAKPLFSLSFDYMLAQRFPDNFKIFVFKRADYQNHVKFMEKYGTRDIEFFEQSLKYVQGQVAVFSGMCEAFSDILGIRTFELGENSVTDILETLV